MKNSIKLSHPKKDKWFGWFTGHGLSLRANRIQVMLDAMLNYGDFIEFKIGPKMRTLMITDPEGIDYVLAKNAKNYDKHTKGYISVSCITGDGIFTTSGAQRDRAKKIIRPFFTNQHLPNYSKIVEQVCNELKAELLETSKQKQPIKLSSFMTQYTLNVLGFCLFDQKLGDNSALIEKELTTLINISHDQLNKVLPIPTLNSRKQSAQFKTSLQKLDGIILNLIQHSKQHHSKNNLIHALEQSDLNIEDGISKDQMLLDHVKTLAFAGHETSASVLTWTLYFLSIEDQYRNEIVQQLEDVTQNEDMQYSHLAKLDLLNKFLKESMRLRPPAWSFGRRAINDDVIYGEKIKAGEIITLSPFLVHHNPRLYENPLKFDPTRFDAENIKARHKASYIPFGMGERFCIGSNLAVIEMMMCLGMILKTFDIQKVDNQIAQIDASISLRMKHGLKLVLIEK